MKNERRLRSEIVDIGQRLYEKGFVASAEGNISARLDQRRILITPSGACKGMLRPQDLLVLDTSGEPLRHMNSRRPSSEMPLHLLCYRLRPEVNAVVHAHPPTATGFAVAGVTLDLPLIPEIVIALKRVPLAPYATPGSAQLSAILEPLLRDHDALLMANHGVVTCGRDLMTAYLNMETVEQFARITLAAGLAGTPRELSNHEVERLMKLRAKFVQ